MAYRGRVQNGDYVPLAVQCTDANGVPTPPDYVPRARIFGPDGAPILDVFMPPLDRYAAPGLFGGRLAIGITFTPLEGNYRIVYTWSIGTFTGMTEDTFQIVGGGNRFGHILSMYYYLRPNADFLIYQTDNGYPFGQLPNGALFAGRNPRV